MYTSTVISVTDSILTATKTYNFLTNVNKGFRSKFLKKFESVSNGCLGLHLFHLL